MLLYLRLILLNLQWVDKHLSYLFAAHFFIFNVSIVFILFLCFHQVIWRLYILFSFFPFPYEYKYLIRSACLYQYLKCISNYNLFPIKARILSCFFYLPPISLHLCQHPCPVYLASCCYTLTFSWYKT